MPAPPFIASMHPAHTETRVDPTRLPPQIMGPHPAMHSRRVMSPLPPPPKLVAVACKTCASHTARLIACACFPVGSAQNRRGARRRASTSRRIARARSTQCPCSPSPANTTCRRRRPPPPVSHTGSGEISANLRGLQAHRREHDARPRGLLAGTLGHVGLLGVALVGDHARRAGLAL